MIRCPRTSGVLALAAAVAAALAGRAGAESPPLWGRLAPGPHAVGFRSLWQLDHSRRFVMTFDDHSSYGPGKAARPILVNVWYPAVDKADGRRMPHRDYLNIRSDDTLLARFSTGLAEYNRAIITREIMGNPAEKLSEREKALLEQFLDTPTACLRDAAPKRGPFPLVIYHAGAGSSFDDNAVLCEFLASHGFVVLGSAFQRGGKSFNTDGREVSARDVQFLIGFARQLPGVDWGHIGLVGHSLGAQAALYYRAQPDSPVDAVVSLDTTQDYHGLKDPIWEDFTSVVARNARHFTGALLMAASSDAFFELADALSASRRYYFTSRSLDHNDYISQGIIHRERLDRLHAGDAGDGPPAAQRAEEMAARERASRGYEALCTCILRFLEAELKGDADGKEYLAKKYRDTRLGDVVPHVEYVPEGRAGPDPYREDSAVPPTPRQLRHFLRTKGASKTIAVLRRLRPDAANAPIYHENFELYLVCDLLDEGKVPDAIAFRDYFRESGLDCNKVLLQIGKGFHRIGHTTGATSYYRRVLLLDPANSEAAARSKELRDGKAAGTQP